MTGRWWILFCVLALGGACAHAKTTDDGTAKETEKDEPKAAKETKPRAPREGGKQGSELHPGDRDAVPVATAPEALLVPGAEEKIRERLIAGGFLAGDADKSNGATRNGIRKFQKAHDLPATGVADHETVKALGLKPNETFRQGTVKD